MVDWLSIYSMCFVALLIFAAGIFAAVDHYRKAKWDTPIVYVLIGCWVAFFTTIIVSILKDAFL